MIAPVVSELQLVGLRAQRQPQDLVTEADPEDRNLAEQPADGGHRSRERLGVARTVREEDTGRIHAEYLLGTGR